jgi:hypothetical protein
MLGVTKLVEWVWDKAETSTADHAIRFCEMYYGPEPIKPDAEASQREMGAYMRQLALWTAGQDMIDALVTELYPTPEDQPNERKSWTIGKKSKELLTASKRIVASIRSGATK